MSDLATGPCMACPYRRDVASGVWHRDEYEKLPPYDRPTAEQPMAAFMCHAEPNNYCFGWAACHSNRGGAYELLALRLRGFRDLPEPQPGLFKSGRQACAHGKKRIRKPTRKAVALVEKLLAKHERLREHRAEEQPTTTTNRRRYVVYVDDWHPPRANQWVGRHWSVKNKMRADMGCLLFLASRPVEMLHNHRKRRVTLEIVLGPRQRGADPDEYWKLFLDAIKGLGWIKDDSRQWVELAPVVFTRGPRKATKITLEDID